ARPYLFVESSGAVIGEVGLRYFAMVFAALLMAVAPALAGEVDPGVTAMLREWSLAAPTPYRVVICHGFGCAFRTEIGLTRADHAQIAAIMAAGSASAHAEKAGSGRTRAWVEKRIAPPARTATRVARARPLIDSTRAPHS